MDRDLMRKKYEIRYNRQSTNAVSLSRCHSLLVHLIFPLEAQVSATWQDSRIILGPRTSKSPHLRDQDTRIFIQNQDCELDITEVFTYLITKDFQVSSSAPFVHVHFTFFSSMPFPTDFVKYVEMNIQLSCLVSVIGELYWLFFKIYF